MGRTGYNVIFPKFPEIYVDVCDTDCDVSVSLQQ